GDPAAEGEELDFLLAKQVDGIFNIPSSENPAYLSRAADRGVPVVLIDRTFHGGRFDSVLADNAGASRSAVAALVRRGHRR
ncbi:MAG TPA: LacI family transcriptional regulator, partial [Ruminococcaceae bacterium]|nr:LacI family transcriptional regulator [Oscillospiraceae bacterium]